MTKHHVKKKQMKQIKKEELNKVITAMDSFDNNISILMKLIKNTHSIHQNTSQSKININNKIPFDRGR